MPKQPLIVGCNDDKSFQTEIFEVVFFNNYDINNEELDVYP